MSGAALATIRRLKAAPFGSAPVAAGDGIALIAIGDDALEAEQGTLPARLAAWRGDAAHHFPTVTPITVDGTAAWVRRQLIERPDRVLFLIRAPDGRFVGHIGLSGVDPGPGSGELDNVIRGEPSPLPGLMTKAIDGLVAWAFAALGLRRVWVKTYIDNLRSVSLYHRAGFVPASLQPAVRVEVPGGHAWRDVDGRGHFDRLSITLVRDRP